ncbi:hypothetical protein EDD98_7509 [Streptomyces sp. PanSC19]|nr:hypothetical protein EDD98_7509 [Streptomyces sp. PanSC19]
MAGMACFKPGRRSRLIYAIREYRGRKDEPKGFGWRDFRDLVVRARIQIKGPIVLVRDNARLHLTTGMKQFIAANAEWLTVFQPSVQPRHHAFKFSILRVHRRCLPWTKRIGTASRK